ncbi:glycosyltransferase [Agrococcus sp. Marseille-P2731]|uniref:glycosyltransferase n=1 Tax=Agrococcus sp. Marseille-P2731 TaxID=1841862 RepID=UPI000930266A|nr:glycosyltransferase [Agrococcus sp. Marseille-P2731]
MSARARVVVALSYEQDPARWRERHERGEVLDATPYGYERAMDRFDMEWTRSHPEAAAVARVRRALAGRLGFDLVHVWRNRALLRSADVIWTHTEREHLAIAAVLRGRGPLVLAQSVWLWDAWPQWGASRRRRVARLLRRHAVEVVHSRVNLADARRAVPRRRVELVPFGSATLPSVREDASAHPPLVLAVGNDVDRDWPLLAAAAEQLPERRFRVISGSRSARAVRWPQNVEHATTATRESLVASMRDAACVVVPVRQNRHASGTTSCIEALGAGRPLVVSDAGGLGDYVGRAARLVEPGDREALVGAIAEALSGSVAPPDASTAAARGLTQADYVERYVLITRWLLGHPWDASVSRFAPVRDITPPAAAER